jgi:hypothetical protein
MARALTRSFTVYEFLFYHGSKVSKLLIGTFTLHTHKTCVTCGICYDMIYGDGESNEKSPLTILIRHSSFASALWSDPFQIRSNALLASYAVEEVCKSPISCNFFTTTILTTCATEYVRANYSIPRNCQSLDSIIGNWNVIPVPTTWRGRRTRAFISCAAIRGFYKEDALPVSCTVRKYSKQTLLQLQPPTFNNYNL